MHNPYIELIRYAWKYGAGQRRKFVLYYILFILGSAVYMLQPFIFGLFLNTIQVGGPDMLLWLAIYLGAYALLDLLKWCFHGPARFLEETFALHVEQQFVDATYTQLMGLPLRWHKDHHSGDTVSRIRKAGTALRSFINNGYLYLETMTQLVFGLIALLIIHFYIGLGGLLVGIFTLWVILTFDRKLIPQMEQYNGHEHTVHSLLFDYISNATTVLILHLGERTRKTVMKRYQGLLPLLQKRVKTNEWKWFTISMVVAAMSFSVLLYYCIDITSRGDVLLVGGLVALYQYLERYVTQFFNFTWQYGEIVEKYTDFRSVFPISDAYADYVQKNTSLLGKKNWKQLRLEGVHFSFNDSAPGSAGLKDISLILERGKRYAFIGESGSGKSTLLTILRGIEEPTKGMLYMDETAHTGTHVLSHISTLCPQDPEIFENTIEYNITVDVPHTKKELDRVVSIARFAPVLQRLPQGIATNIKEKGVNLSGGEKQRLALARGLFAAKDSSLLLLDEPTSSVDPQNEKAIYEEIFAYFTESTIVSSLHRLHLLPMFDYIYLFEKGRLIGEGTFEDLSAHNEHFQKVWKQYKHSQ